MMRTTFITILLVLCVIAACKNSSLDVDVSDINVELNLGRLDHDLFHRKGPFTAKDLATLRAKYGEFFDLYCYRILNIYKQADSVYINELNRFSSDADLQEILKLSDSLYKDFEPHRLQFEECFRYYKYHFPDKPVPDIVTMLSAIQYSFIVTDSVLGISLDKYLGKDCIYYQALEFPKFIYDKLTSDYIVVDGLEAWFLSDYPEEDLGEEMLDQMIYRGKMFYFLDAVAHNVEDSIKIGYSAAQLDWCKQNEYFLWSYFIEHELLFSTNYQKYIKFIDDGNFTPGFPPEAPAQLAAYVGWQIVRSYMQETDASLKDLMNEKNAKTILKESKYKPERSI